MPTAIRLYHSILAWRIGFLLAHQIDVDCDNESSDCCDANNYMNRNAKDPVLNELAAKFKDILWNSPLTADEEDTARYLHSDKEARRRLVYPLPNLIHWSARMYLGGMQRTLAVAHGNELANLFRFADMAQEHFWKYRVRGACPPADRDLNYDRARVESDMANEPHAVALLQAMEKHFLDAGILKSSETRHAEERAKRAIRVNIRTEVQILKEEMNEKWTALTSLVEQQSKRIEDLANLQSAQIKSLEQSVLSLSASMTVLLTGIVARLRELPAARSVPEVMTTETITIGETT